MALLTRNDLHLRRKFFHAFGVLAMFIFLQLLTPEWTWVSLVVLTGVTIGIDIFRLRSRVFNEAVIRWIGPIMRESERTQFSASSYLFFGTGLCFLLFDKTIVSLCLLFLAFGDPIASAVGVTFGSKKWIQNKSIEGSLAAISICFFSAYGFYSSSGLFKDHLMVMSAVSGLIGGLSEAIPLWKMDDNFSQPVISGTLLTALFYFMTTV